MLSPEVTPSALKEMKAKQYDAVIVGGGHNGLIAAAYLAKAGKSVLILEKEETLGGATVSQRVFPDYDARLSRYSYLVSLLPQKIIDDLGLTFTTLGRSVASFTPDIRDGKHVGLLVETDGGEATKASFAAVTGDDAEFDRWNVFYREVQKIATAVAPTMLSPLPTRSELREAVNAPIWNDIFETPIGEVLESHFEDSLVRGVVLTDGLIGTHTSSHDLAANRCFLYHLIGNGTGEWRVPQGGMGNLVEQLVKLVQDLGVDVLVSAEVSSVSKDASGSFTTKSAKGSFASRHVLANCAPQILSKVAGTAMPESLPGSQMKVNMLLKKLPRLKSGVDPRIAFAGTFHIDERYSDLETAYTESYWDQVPTKIPAEIYCHTLTDPTILSDELIAQGYHTLTLFGIHTPAKLFDADHDGVKAEIVAKLLAQMNEYLEDPIEECLAIAKDGSLCIEAKTPQELERDVSLPLGNIFHKDLSWPFREDDEPASWGVETEIDGLFLIGAGAVRGGGVSGIPGHNGAMALLESEE